MTAKHSPAPFRFEDHASPARLIAADGDCIAKVYLTDQGSKKRDEKHAANLRLFAAAPELLAALRRVRESLNAMGDYPSMRADVEDAIAKAERML